MSDIRQGTEILPWLRMLTLVMVLVVFVLLPFALWGEQMDANMPRLVRDQTTKWAVAWIGIGLLVLDVVLPVPSSVVSVSLCFLLGPVWGALTVLVGMVGAFTAGFWLGRLLPTVRVRRWVGARTWDAVAATGRSAGMWWIAASRPVPVLAEVTAVVAGSLRFPFATSLAAATFSSVLVSAAYGASAWLGFGQLGSSTALLALSAICLPAASWAVFQWWRRQNRSALQE